MWVLQGPLCLSRPFTSPLGVRYRNPVQREDGDAEHRCLTRPLSLGRQMYLAGPFFAGGFG